jgi:hypothetical protein
MKAYVILVCGAASLDGLWPTFPDTVLVSFLRIDMSNEKFLPLKIRPVVCVLNGLAPMAI